MKNSIYLFLLVILIASCNETKNEENTTSEPVTEVKKEPSLDKRKSLKLNAMQKNHQLLNMRSHLEAVQTILGLLANDQYDEASKLAYEKLGSTTEMKLMCSSFGDENFANLGLAFHESADEMSEIFKTKDKNKSMEALSLTMNYCVQCHATYRQ